MQAFKCDRCGQFYEDDDFTREHMFYRTIGESPSLYRLEICRECCEKLHNWYMHNEEFEKERKNDNE